MAPDSKPIPGLDLPPTQGVQFGAVNPPIRSVNPVVGAQTPVVADSADLDEEWVAKARDIVEQTKNDPFAQSNELHKIKAGFLKARFNKQINVAEDQP
jgi:hypothetical protein